jgi:hypothetical protein
MRSPEPDTIYLGTFAAFAGAGADQFTLEFGEAPNTVSINRP